MRGAASVALALGVSSALLFAPRVVYADGFVRAQSAGPGIAVVFGTDSAQRIDYAPDGAHFAPLTVDTGSSPIIDLALLDDGSLIAVRADPSKTRTLVTRIVGDRRDESVLATSPWSKAQFALRGRRIALLSAEGVWESSDRGRTWTSTASLPDELYVSTLSLGAGRKVTLLAPEFNTCGSVDRLEGLTRIDLAPGGGMSQAKLSFEGQYSPVTALLARDGFLYTSNSDGETCLLRVQVSGQVRDLAELAQDPRGWCYVHGHDNGRFTALEFGPRLYRATSRGVVALGTLDEAQEADVADVYPDGRGRALVLFSDGSLIRYARSAVPTQLLTR